MSLRLAPLAVLIASAACATPYRYSFQLADEGALEDADVRAEVRVDPTGQRAVLLDLTNKTDQVVQVAWTRIAMTRQDGLKTTLRPDVDLGWIAPGGRQAARLIPFALPPSGDAALALKGQLFELEVPLIVRREPKTYRYTFRVELQKL